MDDGGNDIFSRIFNDMHSILSSIDNVKFKSMHDKKLPECVEEEFPNHDFVGAVILAAEVGCPQPDEPFTFPDQHFEVGDDDVEEVYMEVPDFEYIDEPSMEDFYQAMGWTE